MTTATLTISQDSQKRFLKSVLSNLAEYGLNYRSVIDEESDTYRGLTIDRTAELVFDLDIAHISITHVGNRGRKIGLLCAFDNDTPPAELISDMGAAHKNDIAIADRCIAGGSSI